MRPVFTGNEPSTRALLINSFVLLNDTRMIKNNIIHEDSFTLTNELIPVTFFQLEN
jgi:hypothetical protein